MSNLANQISQFNATQANAQAQFNTGEANTLSRFNAEVANQRDQFNATNQTSYCTEQCSMEKREPLQILHLIVLTN